MSIDSTADHPLLWQAYSRDPSPLNRKSLAERYLPLVRREALRVAARHPQQADFQDLLGMGTVGLLRAIESFDATRGTPFSAYARPRIIGAIKDGLRSTDRMPRRLRVQSDRLKTQSERGRVLLGRTPSETELADLLNMTLSELRAVAGVAARVRSLSDQASTGDEELGDLVEDPASEEALRRLALGDLAASVLRKLSPRKRSIVQWYHLEGAKLWEIGERLGITESRVSQLHSEALVEARLWGRSVLSDGS